MENQPEVAAVFRDIQSEGMDGPSKRALALGRSNLQTGFMWAIRAVDRPLDPFEEPNNG